MNSGSAKQMAPLDQVRCNLDNLGTELHTLARRINCIRERLGGPLSPTLKGEARKERIGAIGLLLDQTEDLACVVREASCDLDVVREILGVDDVSSPTLEKRR